MRLQSTSVTASFLNRVAAGNKDTDRRQRRSDHATKRTDPLKVRLECLCHVGKYTCLMLPYHHQNNVGFMLLRKESAN